METRFTLQDLGIGASAMSVSALSASTKRVGAATSPGNVGSLVPLHAPIRLAAFGLGGRPGSMTSGSRIAGGSGSMAAFGSVLGGDSSGRFVEVPGQKRGITARSSQVRKPPSRRHSTVTFVDPVPMASMEHLGTRESSFDIQKHASR